jgi:hypothetical protein
MDMLTFLPIGFLVGMGHALEADHLAAVATMLDREGGRRALIARGAFWGIGHTASLFLISSAVVLLGLTVSGRVEAVLELVVGLMILALGLQVLLRLRRSGIHLHVHEHDGRRHVHAHSHRADPAPHRASLHRHRHPERRHNLKALAIGMVHGAAGSAGLLVLMVAATRSLGQALAYFLVFGIGSIAGMAGLSAAASVPLVAVHRSAAWLRTGTTAAIGAVAILVGGSMMLESAVALRDALS